MPPRAMMVTPEAPENEVKKAQPSTGTIAAPPRREDGEAERQHGFCKPHGNAVDDDVAAGALGEHEFGARKQQQRGDDHRNRAGEEAREERSPAREQRVDGGEREQSPFARRDCGAEHARDERQVLGERGGAGDARVEQRAQRNFRERQERHGAERRRKGEVLERFHCGLPACAVRYSRRSRCTSSKNSAGTILPRTSGYICSAARRHSASSSGVRRCTLRPRFSIAATDSWCSRRLVARSSTPASAPALASASRPEGDIASHALRVTTMAPTSGAQSRSSMYGACG